MNRRTLESAYGSDDGAALPPNVQPPRDDSVACEYFPFEALQVVIVHNDQRLHLISIGIWMVINGFLTITMKSNADAGGMGRSMA